mgnify:FL=1
MNYSILKKLCMIPSPSGYEKKIVDYICCYKYKNFISSKSKVNSCTFESKTNHNKTILVDAHIDQVHLRIIRFHDDGFAVVQTIGLRRNVVLGTIVTDISGKYSGVICTMPPHIRLETTDEIKNHPRYYVDFGMNKKQIQKIFTVGDPLMYKQHYTELSSSTLSSTGLDNKVSVFILLELLKYFDKNIKELKCNLIMHFSSREEVGLGSFAETDKKNIDTIIVVDTPLATDIPNIPNNITGINRLDGGPIISRNLSDNVIVGNKFMHLGKKHKIRYQTNFSYGSGGTNAKHYTKFNDSFVQDIGTPVRNMHSPVEVVNKKSLENTFKILKMYLKS